MKVYLCPYHHLLRNLMELKWPTCHTLYSKSSAQCTPTGLLRSVVRWLGFPMFIVGSSSAVVTKTICYADLTSIAFIFCIKYISFFQWNTQVYLIKEIILTSWFSTLPMHSTISMGFSINYCNYSSYLSDGKSRIFLVRLRTLFYHQTSCCVTGKRISRRRWCINTYYENVKILEWVSRDKL